MSVDVVQIIDEKLPTLQFIPNASHYEWNVGLCICKVWEKIHIKPRGKLCDSFENSYSSMGSKCKPYHFLIYPLLCNTHTHAIPWLVIFSLYIDVM